MTPEGKRHTDKANDLIDLLIDLRLNKGYSREALRKFVKSPPYNYKDSYANEVVRQAATEFELRAIVNFGADLKEDIERFEDMKMNAHNEGNFKLEKEIMIEIAKLKGHYVEKVEVRGKEGSPIKVIFGNLPPIEPKEKKGE